jgi:uncharacterized damage-inducible protein DinB
MTIKDIETLYDYGYWANRKLMEPLGRLTGEEFTEKICGSYGSIRTTLVHIISAEWGWMARCGGPERGPRLKPEDFPTLQSVTDTQNKVEHHVRTFLSTLEDEDLRRAVRYANESGEKRSLLIEEMMLHAANHSTHHRAQVCLMLRELGHSPGNIDLLFYYGEVHGRPVW